MEEPAVIRVRSVAFPEREHRIEELGAKLLTPIADALQLSHDAIVEWGELARNDRNWWRSLTNLRAWNYT
jgi:hypothetical protein